MRVGRQPANAPGDELDDVVRDGLLFDTCDVPDPSSSVGIESEQILLFESAQELAHEEGIAPRFRSDERRQRFRVGDGDSQRVRDEGRDGLPLERREDDAPDRDVLALERGQQ